MSEASIRTTDWRDCRIREASCATGELAPAASTPWLALATPPRDSRVCAHTGLVR